MTKISAGILLYKKQNGIMKILLVHPGGPFWSKKDDGCWDFPKGEKHEDENDLLTVAKREFKEETNFDIDGDFTALPMVKQKNGKEVHLFAVEGDIDPTQIQSNTLFIDWPPHSGKKLEIPEVDRAEFYTIEEAKKKVWPYLIPLIEGFEELTN